MDNIQWVKDHWVDIVNVLTYTVTAASIIVKYTHNTIDDNIMTKLLKILSLAPKSIISSVK